MKWNEALGVVSTTVLLGTACSGSGEDSTKKPPSSKEGGDGDGDSSPGDGDGDGSGGSTPMIDPLGGAPGAGGTGGEPPEEMGGSPGTTGDLDDWTKVETPGPFATELHSCALGTNDVDGSLKVSLMFRDAETTPGAA